MLGLLYESVNKGLLSEHHLKNQRKYIRQLFTLRKKYCAALSKNKIELSALLEVLKNYEPNYFSENETALMAALREPKAINIIKIKDIILESLALDLENPKLEQYQKINLIKNIDKSLDTLGHPNDSFNPLQEVIYSDCPVTFLSPYTRSGKGDMMVLAAPEKTGKTTLTMINVVKDIMDKGRKILYLDFANGWQESLLRIMSILKNKNYGKYSNKEINTVLKNFKKSEVFLRLMAKLNYYPFPDRYKVAQLLEEEQYDYVVFDDLHRLRFSTNDAESILAAYSWALTEVQRTNQCALVLGHPNSVEPDMDSFVLSGGVRLHKDLTSLIAMLPTDEKNVVHIKIIRERKKKAELDKHFKLNPPISYEELENGLHKKPKVRLQALNKEVEFGLGSLDFDDSLY